LFCGILIFLTFPIVNNINYMCYLRLPTMAATEPAMWGSIVIPAERRHSSY